MKVMMKNISTKKRIENRRQEREVFREAKEAEYKSQENRIGDLLSGAVPLSDDDVPLVADRIRRRVLLGETSGSDFIDHELLDWDRAQPLLISGRYRDQEWIKSDFQFQYISRLRDTAPEIFRELDRLTPSAIGSFGHEKDSFSKILTANPTELAFAEMDLENYLITNLSSAPFHFVRRSVYAPDEASFPNGLRLLFYFLRLTSANSDPEMSERFYQSMTDIVSEQFDIYCQVTSGDTSVGEMIDFDQKRNLISLSVGKLLSCESAAEITCRLLGKVVAFLGYGMPLDTERVKAFIVVHSEVLEWSRKHGMEKEWILQYVYSLLEQTISSSADSVVEATMPDLRRSQVQTCEFVFSFGPWQPAFESREDYEIRCSSKLQEELGKFFRFWGAKLGLDGPNAEVSPKRGRPFDPGYESIDWLVRWNLGCTNQFIADQYNREKITIKNGIKTLQKYDLPIRKGIPGRPKKGQINSQTNQT